MKISDIKEFKKKNNSEIFFDFNVKKLNWFNIGGKSKIFYKPKNLIELKDFLKMYSNRSKVFVLGAGSNVLFKDSIYEGVIIKLGSNFSSISKLDNDKIIAGSSCSQKKVSEFAMENDITGFEFMYCIPGTIGGGIKMNSGCFGSEFKDKLISLQCIDLTGNIKILTSNDIKFSYRSIELKDNLIYLSATFKRTLSESKKIKFLMENLSKKKNISQPSKINQTDKKAWQLIKMSVPAGISFGDACISEKHSNFFVNKNNATFDEMNSLISYVKKKVKDKTGFEINLEIKIID